MYEITDSRFPDLVKVASAYCELIDRIDTLTPDRLLAEVSKLLPKIHAAVVSMPRPKADSPLYPLVDLETRFALFRKLRDMLGECDSYWLEYDRKTPLQGSLADDLTDIYFDLRRGLQLLQDGGGATACARAVSDWYRSYEVHWGEHLVDAERHLFHLMRGR